MKKPQTARMMIMVVVVMLTVGIVWTVGLFVQPLTEKKSAEGRSGSVILTDRGFLPSEITISQGSEVIFSTIRKIPFWPASDLHPSHSLYPEFDPKAPIAPTKDWRFTFTKPGTWKYHDHLNPQYEGVIKALNNKGKEQSFDCNSFSETNSTEKRVCWSQKVDEVLRKKGMTEALKTVEQLNQKEPEFNSVCHDVMHKIGWHLYRDIARGKKIILTGETTMCGYGLYHGFTELLATTPDRVRQARAFCRSVGQNLSRAFPDAELQCYHGLGHGSVIIDNQAMWGNEEAMTADAKKLCTDVSETSNERFRCATGVFDAISIGYYNHDYHIQMDLKDPYKLCRTQTVAEYKKACYISMNTAVMMLFEYDMTRAVPFVAAIENTDIAVSTMQNLVLSRVELHLHASPEQEARVLSFYQNGSIAYCHTLPAYLVTPCIKSVANALSLKEGDEPGYRDAIVYCRSQGLVDTERRECFSSVINQVSSSFGKAKARSACDDLTEAEREYACSGLL